MSWYHWEMGTRRRRGSMQHPSVWTGLRLEGLAALRWEGTLISGLAPDQIQVPS